MTTLRTRLLPAVVTLLWLGAAEVAQAQFFFAQDPGVRGGAPGAGGPISGLTTDQGEMFVVGLAEFSEEDGVGEGVGPRFNFVSCAGCHAQPAVWGTSPPLNPLFRINDPADLKFANNTIPSFI